MMRFSDFITKFREEVKRIGFDVVVFTVLLLGFLGVIGLVETTSNAVQLLLFRALGVSAGFIHAHILRKLAFPKVRWDDPEDDKYKKLLVIGLYLVIIYAYSIGG